jgi:hypothetical protein
MNGSIASQLPSMSGCLPAVFSCVYIQKDDSIDDGKP